MKNNKYSESNTSSVTPTGNYGTSSVPFQPVQVYSVMIDIPVKAVDTRLHEFLKDDELLNISHPNKPKAGFIKGSFVMEDDFEEPIDDFSEYM